MESYISLHVLAYVKLVTDAFISLVGNALSAFTKVSGAYIIGYTYAQFTGVSAVACAALCTRDNVCRSFDAGFSGREDNCFLISADRNTPGVNFTVS